jgi:hypothetical protein
MYADMDMDMDMDGCESLDEMGSRIDREVRFSIVSAGADRRMQILCVRRDIVWRHTICDPAECPVNRWSPSVPTE